MRFLAGFIIGSWIGAVNSERILYFWSQNSEKIVGWIQSLSMPPSM